MIFVIFAIAFYSMILGKISAVVVISATTIALRFSNLSKWAMWVVSDLFEHIGIVKNGVQIFNDQSKIENITRHDGSFKKFKNL
jgi:ATP-binding cassette subfamily B multidrug efflux pump